MLPFPCSRLTPRPTQRNGIAEAFVDLELAREGVIHQLISLRHVLGMCGRFEVDEASGGRMELPASSLVRAPV